jgi:hypothetical protein
MRMTTATMTMGSTGSPPLWARATASDSASLVGLVFVFWSDPVPVLLVVVVLAGADDGVVPAKPLAFVVVVIAWPETGGTVREAAAVVGWVAGAVVEVALGAWPPDPPPPPGDPPPPPLVVGVVVAGQASAKAVAGVMAGFAALGLSNPGSW